MTAQKVKRPWFTLFLLAMLLLGFPALSWYYLRKGADYRINALKELKQDLGKVGDFYATPANWGSITPDSLVGKIVIANIIKNNGQLADKQTIIAEKLQDQFGERRDILFFTLLEGTDSLQAFTYYKGRKVKRNTTFYVFPDGTNAKASWTNAFKFNLKGDFTQIENPYYVYVDINGTIRNFYDVKDENQIKKMVEHIAMKIFDKKENPRVTQEIEK